MSKRSPSDTDEYVGEQLRRARKANRLTQQELAARLGISAQQLQKYETGYNRIPAGRLHEIALVLDIAIADCFPPTSARTASVHGALAEVEARELKTRLCKEIERLGSLESLKVIMGMTRIAASAERVLPPDSHVSKPGESDSRPSAD